jgi:phosphoribosylformylglycinamidine synthase I
MKIGVIVFPGTWSDRDCFRVLSDVLDVPVEYVWHRDTDLSDYDCIVIPGGFSYGDYLRAGAIARFSPVMASVATFAEEGGLVIGICNGFQVLCEAGLLPGVLMRNEHLQFRCQWVELRVENSDSAFTSTTTTGQVIRMPISHGEGNYFADPGTLDMLETEGRVAFRYAEPDGSVTRAANPNGSARNIAGILSERGNVLGMMPHPEKACEEILGATGGLPIFQSIVDSLAASSAAHR